MHWARIGEVGFAGGMRVLFAVYRVCGRWPFRLALYPVIAWYVLVHAAARQSSREYLTRLFERTGGATPAPTLVNVFRHFFAFGETLLDKLRAWSGETDWAVEIHGDEIARELTRSGRGAVLVTAHLGNLELFRMLGSKLPDVRITVLAHTLNAQRFNALMASVNPASALDMVQVSTLDPQTAILLSERIEQGGFVVIAGDRVPLDPAAPTIAQEFLGARAHFPLGPYVLASLLRCPLIAMLNSQRDGRFHFSLTQLADKVVLPRGNRAAPAESLVARYVALLEAECRAAPFQWFNFFPFWAGRKTA
jgi:predicted LPLAT superfamily acyltransferase